MRLILTLGCAPKTALVWCFEKREVIDIEQYLNTSDCAHQSAGELNWLPGWNHFCLNWLLKGESVANGHPQHVDSCGAHALGGQQREWICLRCHVLIIGLHISDCPN